MFLGKGYVWKFGLALGVFLVLLLLFLVPLEQLLGGGTDLPEPRDVPVPDTAYLLRTQLEARWAVELETYGSSPAGPDFARVPVWRAAEIALERPEVFTP